MKKSISLIIIISITLIKSYAHVGGTDRDGGHYNLETGTYHFHHGEKAHQHLNGRCELYTQFSSKEMIERTVELETRNGLFQNTYMIQNPIPIFIISIVISFLIGFWIARRLSANEG